MAETNRKRNVRRPEQARPGAQTPQEERPERTGEAQPRNVPERFGPDAAALAAQRTAAQRDTQRIFRNLRAGKPLTQGLDGEDAAESPTPGGAEAAAAALPLHRIGKEDVLKASLILQKYRSGKKNLENKIVENEQWYRLRHWNTLDKKDGKEEVQPASAWLLNAILNKHADAMDNIPAPAVLPREEGDRAEAEKLSAIIPVVLEQNDFEQVYSDVSMYKFQTGAGVYGVFWDPALLNGLGDIAIRKVDILHLFWEPGVSDIQQSRHLFHVELRDNEELEELYPELRGNLQTPTQDLTKYAYADAVDTSGKSSVVDWYYHRRVNGRTVLHYCRYVNGHVLYATENDPKYAARGWYDHGQYPFIFDVLFPIEGSPAGLGYIDIGKNAQEYVDRGGQAVLQNMMANARPRHFINTAGSVNEAEYADVQSDFVHVVGQLGADSIRPIEGKPLAGIYFQVLQAKIEELKETTGNRDVNTGGHTAGVTAASAIAAMQEAGGKLSRDNSKAAYRAYRRLVLMVIELIRQFYDMPRQFRIVGAGGEEQFVSYSNEKLRPQPQIGYGADFGDRIPLFDVQVHAQRQNPYSKAAQNELALQLYQAGMFSPQMADAALLCLDMMDFDRKNEIIRKVQTNGTLMQRLMQAEQVIAALSARLGIGAAGAPTGGGQQTPAPGAADMRKVENAENGAESHVTRKARQEAAERISPR